MEDICCVKDLLNRGGGYTRLERCLPFHPNHSVASKVPQVCMAGDSLPVMTFRLPKEKVKQIVQMCSSRTKVNNTRAGPPHRDPGSNMFGGDTSAIALPQSSTLKIGELLHHPSYELKVLLE